jgi:sulfate/thiosulfate transport system ATP-binding protein
VRKELRAWLRRLHDDVHVTTVLVTHDQEEAMEVAETIVLMNHGKIVQSGTPAHLYDHPADEFVMGFIGQVNRLGDEFIRPHDVTVQLHPNGHTRKAVIERLIHLGFEVRTELLLDDGHHLAAQLTRRQVDELELTPGRDVYITLEDTRVFDAPEASSQ